MRQYFAAEGTKCVGATQWEALADILVRDQNSIREAGDEANEVSRKVEMRRQL
jgi:hypothetical protein